MTNTVTSSFKFLSIGFLLLVLTSTLSSFSTIPVADAKEQSPPIETAPTAKENRRKARLNKRYNKLYQRFEQTTNSKKRLRLQHKIRQVERQLEQERTAALAVAGLSMSVIGLFIMFMAFASVTFGWLVLAGALIIIGLITSIVHLVNMGKNPKRYILRGLAIGGIIISGVGLLILSLFLISRILFW